MLKTVILGASFLALIPTTPPAQSSSSHLNPKVVKSIESDLTFVPETKDYDKDVLTPLRAAQAKKAAEEAELARIAAEKEKARLDALQSDCEARGGILKTETCIVPPKVSNVSYTASQSANGYVWGQCTWYVASMRNVPSNWGNAVNWLYNAKASGYATGLAPQVGAIAWTGLGYAGHVAYVESVDGLYITISEMNYNGGVGIKNTRTVLASLFTYIY